MPSWLLITAAGLSVGAWLAWRSASTSPVDRIVLLALPPLLLFVALATLERIVAAPFWDWTAVRLASSFALVQGHGMYPSPTDGPTLSYIYGPIFAVAFLPATVSNQPTVAITIAMVLQLAYFFVPALLLVRVFTGPGSDVSRNRVLAACVFALLALDSRALFYSGFALHADGPALGLLSTACLLLLRSKEPSTRRLVAVGLLASLAVWCKQPAMPIFIALPLWLWVVEGRRTAARALLVFGAMGTLVSAIMLAGFGFSNMYFNMFTLPSMVPWKPSPDGRWALFRSQLRELAKTAAPYLGMAIAGLLLGPPDRLPGRAQMGGWLKQRRWPLLLLIGILTVPTSVLGIVKRGGAVNSLSFTIFFVTLAGTLALLDTANRGSGWRSATAKLLLLAAGIGVTVHHVAAVDPEMFTRGRDHLRRFWQNPQQQANEMLAEHPGKIYFPWNPLAHLMVEDRLYHVEYGVNERRLAGIPMPRRQFRAQIPPDMRYLAFDQGRQSEWTRRDYLPEYSIRTELPGYPDWIIYRRAEES
ncbi:MAG: hypothetical protein PVJ49_00235 [Acidobacteriota bacterium]|jgi:hypothetical protein